AFDYLINFFFGMEVLMDRRAAREVVMREGHVLGVKVAAVPAWQSFNDRKITGIEKRHGVPTKISLRDAGRGGQQPYFSARTASNRKPVRRPSTLLKPARPRISVYWLSVRSLPSVKISMPSDCMLAPTGPT